MIPVTKPFLPPLSEYQKELELIWKRNFITNNGPVLNDLELKLKETFSLKHLLAVANGTIGLQIAMKALDLTGEVITTPFSYVATTSSISWEGLKPIFADINPNTLNIDPKKIEGRITDRTSGIVATHCFGVPCDMDAISHLADKYNLKVIYDASHCHFVEYQGRSILEYGDISVMSTHGTKLYHTVEGGVLATANSELTKRMAYLRNFGHDGPAKFNGVGINGKMSEVHAAMGVVNLKYIDQILASRKLQSQAYDGFLANLRVQKPVIPEGTRYNYSYYPVLFESEKLLLKSVDLLNANEIFPRRYFYPSLSKLEYVDSQEMPICEDVSRRVLCLPLYHELTKGEQQKIARLLLRAQNN